MISRVVFKLAVFAEFGTELEQIEIAGCLGIDKIAFILWR